VTLTPPRDAAVVGPPLVKIVFDDDGWWIPRIREMGAPGLVLEAMGGGHVPKRLSNDVAELAASIPVIITSRTGSGEVLRSTYGNFPGSETWLIEAGLIPAGSLDSLKARVLLALLLAEGASRERIESVFATLGSPARGE
jgi:L-asparaginase